MKRMLAGRRRLLLCMAILIAGLVAIAAWASSRPATAAISADCRNNIHQLVLALRAFEAGNGAFPPAVIYDGLGQPMHSWRALILPYLEVDTGGLEYDFDQPWNSRHNLAVAKEIGDQDFFCRGTEERTWWGGRRPGPAGLTNYVAVTGPGTAFPGDQQTSLEAITDRQENTILLVEYALSDIQILEPRDITANHFVGAFARLQFSPGARSGSSSLQCVLSRHPTGVHIGMADGSARCIDRNTHIDTLKALTTIAAGDDMDEATPSGKTKPDPRNPGVQQ